MKSNKVWKAFIIILLLVCVWPLMMFQFMLEGFTHKNQIKSQVKDTVFITRQCEDTIWVSGPKE